MNADIGQASGMYIIYSCLARLKYGEYCPPQLTVIAEVN